MKVGSSAIGLRSVYVVLSRMFSWFNMMYSTVPAKVLVLSPVSSSSNLVIWLAILSFCSNPSFKNPKEKKSATIPSVPCAAGVVTSALLTNNNPTSLLSGVVVVPANILALVVVLFNNVKLCGLTLSAINKAPTLPGLVLI